ncbi:hypothetical protein J1N35_011133 [Gossypium stocksii]|uniref:Uncharacterized protein n=1 Tax=Gossypium stocksii TaxID=47602 RepID=A0A9D3W3W2_9ROSI|nr:hypothetical protein J1N35_011133 [Gossypium stocksii]
MGPPRDESMVVRMTHLGRTTMLVVFATLSMNYYMVSSGPLIDRRWELKAISTMSMLLAGLIVIWHAV